MRQSASIFTAMCLTLLVACSTNRAAQTPPVKTVVLDPPAPLLVLCAGPVLVPSKTNGDIINNSLARQQAFEMCDARQSCLVRWYIEAKKLVDQKGVTAAVLPTIPEGCQ